MLLAARWYRNLQARQQLRTTQGCRPCAEHWPQLSCPAVAHYTVCHRAAVCPESGTLRYACTHLISTLDANAKLQKFLRTYVPGAARSGSTQRWHPGDHLCVLAGFESDALSQLPVTLLREVAGRPTSQLPPAVLMDVATAAHLASRLADSPTQQELAVAAANAVLSSSASAPCSADATGRATACVLQAR